MNIQHVALIMDGNRRWARERNLPLLEGHRKGAEQLEPIVDFAISKGISYLTFWAFSTENWNRTPEEVNYLLELFREALFKHVGPRLLKKNVRIKTIGDMMRFPEDIQKDASALIEKTKDNTACTVVFALNYGGRDEILRAVNRAVEKGEAVSADTFEQLLDTKDIPDPDIIIRTGGEKRLSGYLPWQGVYSELFFPDVYWPSFDEKEFQKILDEFEQRDRRFGK